MIESFVALLKRVESAPYPPSEELKKNFAHLYKEGNVEVYLTADYEISRLTVHGVALKGPLPKSGATKRPVKRKDRQSQNKSGKRPDKRHNDKRRRRKPSKDRNRTPKQATSAEANPSKTETDSKASAVNSEHNGSDAAGQEVATQKAPQELSQNSPATNSQ